MSVAITDGPPSDETRNRSGLATERTWDEFQTTPSEPVFGSRNWANGSDVRHGDGASSHLKPSPVYGQCGAVCQRNIPCAESKRRYSCVAVIVQNASAIERLRTHRTAVATHSSSDSTVSELNSQRRIRLTGDTLPLAKMVT